MNFFPMSSSLNPNGEILVVLALFSIVLVFAVVLHCVLRVMSIFSLSMGLRRWGGS